MERRVRGNSHARCGTGERSEIISGSYLSSLHLLRLYYMCIDILEQRKVITYRAKERPQLLEVRCGAFRKPDGTYHSGFFDLHNDLVARFEYAQKHTELPIRPDFERANEFVFEMNKLILAY